MCVAIVEWIVQLRIEVLAQCVLCALYWTVPISYGRQQRDPHGTICRVDAVDQVPTGLGIAGVHVDLDGRKFVALLGRVHVDASEYVKQAGVSAG